MTEKQKVIGMFSGGLDSILATKIMQDEGFDVIVLHFYNGFNGKLSRELQEDPGWTWTPSEAVIKSADRLGIRMVTLDVSREFTDILFHPRYNYGSAANPCIDCRIFLLKKAREIMEVEDALLVFTGEVVGQRPMSQHKPTLRLVEKRAGIEGRLLRPLSAKLLDPTIPEQEGLVNREHLYDFSGRSRKPQRELAAKFGIDWYPESGGGCLLTDISFGRKFFDSIEHTSGSEISHQELNSLKAGRHLRLESEIKVIVGRNEAENDFLEKLLVDTCWIFDVRDFPGAAVFAFGEPAEDDFLKIASICGRYSKGLHEDMLIVLAKKGNEIREFKVKPAKDEDIIPLFVSR